MGLSARWPSATSVSRLLAKSLYQKGELRYTKVYTKVYRAGYRPTLTQVKMKKMGGKQTQALPRQLPAKR